MYVTWRYGLNSSEIHFNRSLDGGTTWLAMDVRLETASAGSSSQPVVAASGPSAYVAWTDGRNKAGFDIYLNQPFGFQPYGPSLAGSATVAPRLVGAGRPTIGGVFTLDVSSGLGGASGALLFGTQKTFATVMGGTLLVVPVVHIPVQLGGSPGSAGTGTTSIPIPLPNNPALVGAGVNVQAVFFDIGAVFGLSMTAGLEIWIG